MDSRTDVILVRFSSELQRTDSNSNQERRCREGLERKGIPHGHFRVIADEAVSGTRDDRPGLEEVKRLIYSGRLGTLVVTEQSRLSRGDNVKGLVKDVVFHGGRFITIVEGIDTNIKGWKMLVGISEIHHAHSNEDTAERVRGGQSGRVLDGRNGSAGDFPYGYKSEFVDPHAALASLGRGPKPKKEVAIEPAAAAAVLEVFARFAEAGDSISSVVRWWEANKEKYPAITKRRVHHQHVRRILTNEKYVGRWPFGRTTTVRDQHGRKKQVPARADQQVVVVDRSELRIVPQALWDEAQQRLERLKEVYGMKEDGAKRGPGEYYKLLFEKTLLGGLVRCACCGSRMTVGGSGKVKRLGCPKHRVGQCPMAARVPYEQAEQAVLAILTEVLLQYPDWVRAAARHARSAAADLSRTAPDELASLQTELGNVEGEIGNLVGALAKGLHSDAVSQRLVAMEQQKGELSRRITERKEVAAVPQQLPPEAWIALQLKGLAALLKEDMARVAPMLRSMIGEVVAEAVIPAGKKRGYTRIRFSLDGWATVRHVWAANWPRPCWRHSSPPTRRRGVPRSS